MALYINVAGNIYDDMDGCALTLPSWPQGLVQITLAEADAIRNPPKSAAQITQDLERAFDLHLDAVAEAKGYKREGVRPSASCIG